MRKHNILDYIRESSISIKVSVPDVKRDFTFKVVGKTRVKELCNRVCQLLDLDPIRTDIILYPQYGLHELNPASTLTQNNIQNGSVLAAKIHYTGYGSKVNTFYKVISKKKQFGNQPPEAYVNEDDYPVYSLKTHSEMYGLKVKGICTNKDCIAYNKEVTFPYGIGTFDVNTVLTKTKCQTCPYKDKDLQKPITVRNITLVNCCWKLEGHYFDSNGFYNYKYMKHWIKTEGADPNIFYDKIKEVSYIDPKIIVKEL